MRSTILLLFGLVSSLADEPKKPIDFDANRNGRLEFKEFVNYQIAVRDPKFSELDADKDGNITSAEKDSWAELFWADAQPEPPVPALPLDRAATSVPPPKQKAWTVGPLRLRKDHESLLKDLDKADPASAGFYRNNLEGKDTWAVEGALGAVFEIYNPEDPLSIGNYELDPFQFVPSVSLNRVTGKGDGKLEVADSLVFRGGLAFGLQSANTRSFWDHQLFALNYRSSGTTGGGKFTSAGEVDWEPMRNRDKDFLSVNGPEQPPSFWREAPFLYRFVFLGRAEFGDSLIETEPGSFIKIGTKLGLTVSPRAFRQLQLFAYYTYLWEVSNGSEDFDLFEVGARLALDENKQVFLEGKYRYGQLPAKYTDLDLFQLSLAVKF